MKFISQIKDAAKYTFKDWKTIVLLGIILCIASTSEEFTTNNNILLFILSGITLTLLIIEEGYRYTIIKETIEGNNRPPIIGNLFKLIKEGIIETFSLAVYIGIVLALFTAYDKVPKDQFYDMYQIIIFILLIIIYLMFFGYAINKALHGSKFLSAFNIIEIFKLYYKIGIVQSIFLFIVGSISLNIMYTCVFNIGIFQPTRFIEFILSFFINPILLLFITRLMALCGREAIPSQNQK
ncbi:DUF4013 domain-containing protein [uncultured Methanobrevibacter sp.]|uniref:DUF4013 domain-containing protein n=1 Tax=uncultured Methanobrevibacter sp. TaxID=253161 RepID=UPI0026006ED9|nr:DUF4013 domain-containing protein [uncultured Methanobrevibacter sp.]